MIGEGVFAVQVRKCLIAGFVGIIVAIAVGGWTSLPFLYAPVFIVVAFLAALFVALFWDLFGGSITHRTPQASVDAKMGTRHTCSDGKSAPWQYIGPQEVIATRKEAVWRRFRVCPLCGECQYWPVISIGPEATNNWNKWRPIIFDEMMTRIKIREELLRKLKSEEETKKRLSEEQLAKEAREAAEAAARTRESNEKAREFINAEVQLLNKPDEEESRMPELEKST